MHQQDIERVKREQREAFRNLALRWQLKGVFMDALAEAYLMGERNEKERVK